MKTELLAPAGDIEAGYAALFYGADAVYLGLQQFSARATATNFSEENLNEFVGYAHHLGRKVYAAVNTLVQEKELSDLLKSLDICSRCKVDAVILQDLGVARIIRESYPELEMHASTQMAVHNCRCSGVGDRGFYSRGTLLFLQRSLSVFVGGNRTQRQPRQMFISLPSEFYRRSRGKALFFDERHGFAGRCSENAGNVAED